MTLLESQPDDVLELDELWSFVGNKANKRWIWIALCRRTRQVVAYFIGDRSEESCWRLWHWIPAAYRQCHTFSDLRKAYQAVFCSAGQHHQSVGKETGQTTHVERWNNTLAYYWENKGALDADIQRRPSFADQARLNSELSPLAQGLRNQNLLK